MKALVLLPSYNSGAQLLRTVIDARKEWSDVWVVIDASTDRSDRDIESITSDGLRLLRLEKNSGKGGAVLHALRVAASEGYTHALVMDADGQHPPEMIRPFMELAKNNPDAFLCGVPIFGPDAPIERVKGRRVGNFFATVETLGIGAADSLFGFRLYPVRPALEILEHTTWARRFDFDTVLAVRLCWSGRRCLNIPVPVRYPPRREGGVTHFEYIRDNLLLVAAHTRLLLELPVHIPQLLLRRY